MSKTISFVATDELAEWLEEESERRMTTISSTAQQLLAEKYRESEKEGSEDPSETPEEEAEAPESEEADESGDEGESDESDHPPEFDDHPDKWYVPNSQKGYKYAVKMPGDQSNKYYKTQEGAAERLRTEYK